MSKSYSASLFEAICQCCCCFPTTDSKNDSSIEDFDGVEKFKRFWEEKLKEALELLHPKVKDKDNESPIFHILLELYAHKDTVKNLYRAYDFDSEEVEFYIPQLCTFLLHGHYEKAPQLECFLLVQCSQSLHFAHRLHWFLESFCANGVNYESEGLNATLTKSSEKSSILSVVELQGGVSAYLMNEGVFSSNSHPKNIKKSPAEIPQCTKVLMAPILGEPKFDSDSVSKDIEALLMRAQSKIGSDPQRSLYNRTPSFISSLTSLADRLYHAPLSDRNISLRKSLKQIESIHLPSNVVYMPVGHPYHVVKRIIIEESFVFNSKERVPFLICVEVVDYVKSSRKNSRRERSASDQKKNERRDKKSKELYKMKFPFNKTLTVEVEDDEESEANPEKPGETLRTIIENHQEVLPETKTSVGLDQIEEMKEAEKSTHPSQMNLLSTAYKESIRNMKNIKIRFEEDDEDELEDATNRLDHKEKSHDIKSDGEADDEDENKNGLGQWKSAKESRRRQKGKRYRKMENAAEKFESFRKSFATRTSINQRDLPSSKSIELSSSRNYRNSGKDKFYVLEEEPEESTEKRNDNSGSEGEIREINEVDDLGEHPSVFSETDIENAEDSDVHCSRDEKNKEDIEDIEDTKPMIVFKEKWSQKEARLREESPFGHEAGWRLLPVIVKSNDDLRQEQIAAQLISQFQRIFKDVGLKLFLRPYDVVAISDSSGIIEAIPDTLSLDSLKRNDPEYTTLRDFFGRYFKSSKGVKFGRRFKRAKKNFIRSLAAYSIVCYLLRIKDRHNGNILIDANGHVIHIDFGFIFTNSPGNNMNFEKAPFKLTDEFVELMDGPRSSTFREFRALCIQAFLAARKEMESIVLLVEMMLMGNINLPCFAGGKKATIDGLRDRFNRDLSESACRDYVNQLIDLSLNNWRTRWYDKYQRCCVGIW